MAGRSTPHSCCGTVGKPRPMRKAAQAARAARAAARGHVAPPPLSVSTAGAHPAHFPPRRALQAMSFHWQRASSASASGEGGADDHADKNEGVGQQQENAVEEPNQRVLGGRAAQPAHAPTAHGNHRAGETGTASKGEPERRRADRQRCGSMRAGRRANASTDHPEHASAAVGEVGEDEVVRGRVATTCCCIMERSELAFFGQEEDDYGGSSEDRIKSLLADGDRGIPRRRIARRPGHSAPIMFSEVRATLSPRPLPAVRPGPVVLFGLPVARPRGLILSRGLGAALRPADAAGEQPQGHRHDARLEQQQGAARRRDGPAALL
eukprot:gene4416-biopygen5337